MSAPNGKHSSTRADDPRTVYRRKYFHYLHKTNRLEDEVNQYTESLKARWAKGYDGKPRDPASIDKMIGEDPQWKQLVEDQKFAERHVNYYGPAAQMEQMQEMLQAMTVLTKIMEGTLRALRETKNTQE